MKRCLRCFYSYEEEYEICPHCGYMERTQVDEPQYLHPGTVLQNRYQIGVVIGAGGFGITYGAWDSVLEQRVAIKEYMPGEFSTRAPGETQVSVYGGEKEEQFEAGKNKFYEESKRLAKFQDVPGVVQIYNSFEENATAYIVMEYLEGETLAERLRREKKIPEEEAVQLILPVLQALEAVHREGILHRDIAPNNIFLTKDGGVKLLDFGASRSVTGMHSKSLTVLYKEGYTPEEQYRSRGDQGPWTDVYAVAATLYRMVTGEVPPGALERRRKDTLKAPSRAGAHVSKQVDQAILNALNVEVCYRTQSAEQLIGELTGDGKVKGHFVRTIERRVGRIPLPVKIVVGIITGGMLCFLGLLATGVIHFDLAGFGDFMVPEGKSRVPNVVNESVEEAQSILEAGSLAFKITDKQFSEEIPKDRILSQSVQAGKIIEQGSEISVVVSGGSKTQENGYELAEGETFVPDVQYKSLEEAQQLIEEAGLTADVQYRVDDSVEIGRVIGQEPEAGEVIAQGGALTFYVSEAEPEQTGGESEEAEDAETEEEEETQTEAAEAATNAEQGATESVPAQSGTVAGAGNEQRPAEAAQLLGYINQYRAQAGLNAMTWSTAMETQAQNLAVWWATDSQGEAQSNYIVLFCNNGNARTAEGAVREWMTTNSRYLLDPEYTAVGGALYYYASGPYWPEHWVLCIG